MNLQQIIAEARLRMDDEVEPYLVTDEAIIGWANEAEREACIRGDLLLDTTEAAGLTTFAVTPGTAVYSLHPKVLRIASATFTRDGITRPHPLELKGLDWMERTHMGAYQAARPCVLADDGRHNIHLWPMPGIGGTLQLRLYRLPLQDMADPDDEPEIAEHLHLGLIDWILYRAWSRPHADMEDQPKAGNALGEFTQRYGIRNTATVLRQRRERLRKTTRYGGL